MASPFSVFRKNQKVMMALLVGFAMFAFIVADSLNATNIPIFLGATLGALALWLLSGKGGSEGWLIAGVGAILGAVVGVYGPTLLRDNTAVDTAHGPLSINDLEQINQRQETANRFLSLADLTIRERLPEDEQQRRPGPQYFGFVTPGDPGGLRENAVLTFLFGKEADALGINITDQAVNQYIFDATGGQLKEADLRRIRSDMQVGTGDLIDSLREQLRARAAFQLLAPRVGPTPEELWADFRKLTQQAEVTVAALPTEEFVAQVDDPTSEEVTRLFEQYKGVPPAFDGTPGFLVPREIQVAYLEITLDEMKKTVEPPTDEEVLAYYESNRAQFELGHGQPDGEAPATSAGETPAAPVEAPRRTLPANDATEPAPGPVKNNDKDDQKDGEADNAAGPPATEPKTGTASDPASGPESEPQPAEPTATPDDEAPDGENQSGFDRRASEFVAFQEADPAEPPASEAATESEKSEASSPETEPAPQEPPASKPAETRSADGKPISSEPATTEPADKGAAPPLEPPAFPAPPAGAATTTTSAPPSVQTLESIRQDLLNQRARAAADERVEQVREALYSIVQRIMDEVPIPEDPRDEAQKRKYDEQRGEAVQQVVAEMKEYASKNDLTFMTTPMMSGEELLDSEDHPIGQAVRWEKNPPLFNRDTTPLTQTLFTMSPDQPLSPIAAQSLLNESRYVALKVADVEPRVPSLQDEGVREAVVNAWKLREARELAQARAEQLAKTVSESKGGLAELGKHETVTGTKAGTELAVRQEGPFSWLRRTTAPSTDFSPPDIVPTSLPQFPAAGEQFMQAVFDEIKVGQAGVAPSEDGSAFFVVQVDRRGSDAELAKAREDFLKEDFFRHPLDGLFGFPMNPFRRRMAMEARETRAEWFQEFRKKHDVSDGVAAVPPTT